MINLELFSCAGGMAEGFRRAGVHFDLAVDFAPDHCDSYEANIGHRPLCMDARDLLRLVRAGHMRLEVDLLVADPPCTPWSRAGKRKGTADERDMLQVTCELIAALRPRRYLIGNVPGLDDGTNLSVVQRHIGGLARHGYCVRDFARLDAADYGVPQHRIRPWWFGHLEGPCIRWPAPTHAAPAQVAIAAAHRALPGHAMPQLLPWVTCRQALGHLEGDELGRPVKMRKRACHGKQLGSVADSPARVVGTSNLSDGNTLSLRSRHDEPVHTSELDAPARAITTQCRAPGHATTIVLNDRHTPATPATPDAPDAPAPTLGAKMRGQSTRTISPDTPATTIQAREDRVGSGSPVLEWPWTRPSTTVMADPNGRLPPPGHHIEGSIMSLPGAIILSELAATILQGFPESWVFAGKTKKSRWSQIGQAMPIALAHAVAASVRTQDEATRDQAELALEVG